MATFQDLVNLSPLPLVDLDDPAEPSDGSLQNLSELCKKHYQSGTVCANHYLGLTKQAAPFAETPIQCPFGFSSLPFKAEGSSYALTGFVPFPRLGGAAERQAAKRFPETKRSTDSVRKLVAGLRQLVLNVTAVEDATIQRHSFALHEIRKLNAKVKRTAERLCRDEAPNNPETARSEIVMIWKAAELMSNQFEVMELLANQRLAELPVTSKVEVYRLFDKCMRVYRMANEDHNFIMRSTNNYHPRILACEKTLPIIPTVLIENANRYSKPGTEIRIFLETVGDMCQVTVSSLARGSIQLDDSIFKRGVRASSEKEGSGNGLYVAQLVAKQHDTLFNVRSISVGPDMMKHEFIIPFHTID